MSNTNDFLSFLLLGALVLLYLLPIFIAYGREHHQKVPILLVTLFLGWTAIGWLAALVWSASATRPTEPEPPQKPQPEFVPSSHRKEPPPAPLAAAEPDPETKACPYCAETIKAAAIVCRYCGRELSQEPKIPTLVR